MGFNNEKGTMKSNNMFREQVNSVTSWFSSWSACEQTVALYSLLKQVPPLQCRFLVEMLQQRLSDNKEVIKQEEEANDPAFICKLTNEPKEHAISELLSHLPLLHSGNTQAKTEYLKLIPIILSHSIENGVFIEESRQLLSYSLIHPAITSDERSKFNMWLGHLDERFSNYHSPNQVQGQVNEGQGQCYSQTGDDGVSTRTHMTLTKAHSIGSGRLNGCWNVNVNANNMYNSSDSMNLNGLESHGHWNMCGSRQQISHSPQVTSSGHMPLQPTRSAPANFTAIQPPPSSNSQNVSQPVSHHAPLRRMPSFNPATPPANLPLSDASVSDWLKSNNAHLMQGPGRPCYGVSDHAPLSPQSSTASSGSGSDTHPDDIPPQPTRNTFMEEGSGMRDVPLWLKSLRLHKYASLFQQLTYEEMMNLNEEWLGQQAITKGARNKIVLNIKKLLERQDLLRSLEKDITEGGSIKNCICEMKAMLNTPIKAFTKPGTSQQVGSPVTSPGVDGSDSIQEGDIPGQFTRLMAKVCTQLLTSPYDDEGLNMYLQLIDKCINHEAFSQKQKKLLETWKQQARKIWQPAPYKYGFDKKPRSNWGNTFPVSPAYNSRPIQRTGMWTSPKQVTSSGAQWCFGAKRSVVGGTMSSGHLPVQRNSSHNAMIYSQPRLTEQPVKQPLSRTQSAPLRSQAVGYGAPASENSATDIEINARLDSLCRSVTECALGGQDGNEKGPGY